MLWVIRKFAVLASLCNDVTLDFEFLAFQKDEYSPLVYAMFRKSMLDLTEGLDDEPFLDVVAVIRCRRPTAPSF